MADPAGLTLHQSLFADANTIPTNRLQVEMLVVMYLTALLAYVIYGLRMYSKITSRQIGLEDWFMTAATLPNTGVRSLSFEVDGYDLTQDGPTDLKCNYAGVLPSDVPRPYNMVAANFTSWLTQLLYSPILGLVRSSTLFFMLKITGHIRNIRWTIHVINIINMCLTVATVLGVIFSTTPVSAFWDVEQQLKHQYRTIDLGAFVLSVSCMSIIADFFVLGIPFWAFMRTQLPLGTRLGVVMIFMTGGLATAMGIARFCVFAELYVEPSTDSNFLQSWGPTYGPLETNIAIMTACLPVMYPLLRRWFPRVFGGPSSGKRSAAEKQERSGYAARAIRAGEEGSIRMQDFGQRRGSVHLWSDSNAGSNEELFKPAGILKTTHIQVSYSNAEAPDSAGISRKDTPRAPDPSLGF